MPMPCACSLVDLRKPEGRTSSRAVERRKSAKSRWPCQTPFRAATGIPDRRHEILTRPAATACCETVETFNIALRSGIQPSCRASGMDGTRSWRTTGAALSLGLRQLAAPATFPRDPLYNAEQAASAYMNFLCRPDAEALLAKSDFARLWPFFTNMRAGRDCSGTRFRRAARGRASSGRRHAAPAIGFPAVAPVPRSSNVRAPDV